VFFLFEAIGKLRWLIDSQMLAGQLDGWLHAVGARSISGRYLHAVAIPWARVFARLVPVGEFAIGTALLLGVWTPIAAALAFLMVLNFHIASGLLFRYAFLTSGYGLPVLGGLAALILGGSRLPWSLRS
jgi:uncharacterized membrane protein YphA (DoxX/SURF4 family)